MTHTLQLVAHTLRPDRCVVEVTRRPFGRARLRAVDGALVTDGERSLTIAVEAGSLKSAGPWLGPAIRGPKHPSPEEQDIIRFTSTRADANWTFTGQLTVRGAWYDLTLRARQVYADDSTVVIAAVGRTGRARVEIAAEFGR